MFAERGGSDKQHHCHRPEFRVVEAGRQDMPRVREMCKPLLNDHPQLDKWFDRNADAFCTDDRPIWLVRLGDDEIVGLLIGRFTGEGDSKCSLLYVKPEFRDTGLGSLLLQTFEERAKAAYPDVTPFSHLNVYIDQKPSVKFFLDRGYKVTAQFFHETKNVWRQRLRMEKQL